MTAPGLLVNQVLTELRHNWMMIGVCWSLLVLELLDGLSASDKPFDAAGNLVGGLGLHGLAQFMLILTGAALAIKLGFADAPTNANGFIHTRPVAFRKVWGAKATVLALFVALPSLCAPFFICLFHGAGIAHALHAAADRLAIAVPVLAFFLCWGGLCGSATQLAVMTTIVAPLAIFAGFMGTGLILMAAIDKSYVYAKFEEPGSRGAHLVAILYLFACIALLALIRQLRGRRKRHRVLGVAGAMALASAACMAAPRLNFLAPRAELPTDAAKALGDLESNIDPYSIDVWLDKGGAVNLHSRVEIAHEPVGYLLRPDLAGVEVSDGKGFQTESVWRRPSKRWKAFSSPSRDLLYALARTYGGERAFREGVSSSGSMSETDSYVLARWKGSGLAKRLDEALDLRFQLNLDCLKLTRVARLPLRDGASALAQDGRRFTLFHPEAPTDDRAVFALRFRRAQLLFTRDESKRYTSSSRRGQYRYLCVAVHPDHKTAVLCPPYRLIVARGELAGFPESLQAFNYGLPSRDGTTTQPAFVEGAEIHVFEMRWLGTIETDTVLERTRLAGRMIEVDHGDGSQPRLDRDRYAEVLARLGDPPFDSGPEALKRYLAALTRIIDRANERRDDEFDPGVRRLFEIGRREGIELLIETLGSSRHAAQQSVRRVIERLAEEDDKAAVIAALEAEPELAQVVVSRGWEREAKAEIQALLRAHRILPYSVLQAAMLLRDPKLHAGLLEQFAHTLRPGTYELLGAEPALRPGLDEIVEGHWRRYDGLVIRTRPIRNGTVRLALRTGNPDALRLALQELKGPDSYNALQALRKVLLLHANTVEAKQSVEGLSVEDFRFDAQRRVFIRTQPPERS